ncbi:rhodanese-like domain-containing protein [Thaumasiovibrio subtropicus]|uniref:rhodanese-like domain-containing protein n=1 Tax=Thaumasiovibrio subtropicus TaxID=1891207 RepID=UPI000B35B871|nr:rhodanese-like domain-containing protein [Thaumasiovibrio subtropicus]
MQEFMDFISNNTMLSLVWVGLFVALIASIVKQKTAAYATVDAQGATMLINREEAVVVDIRSKDEYNKGHIVDAFHVLPSQIRDGNTASLENHKSAPIIVVCKTGQTAQESANLLAKGGFERVYVLKDGLIGWNEAKMPLVSGKRAKKK